MSASRNRLLHDIYLRLDEAYGPQNWWPADTAFEVILGAILTQNTAWKNVAKAIANLRENRLLSFRAVCETPAPVLAELIRPSGYYNQKTKKVKAFCEHILTRWDGSLEDFLSQEIDPLRAELLGIRGIGPETADCIVLYAAHLPSFVVDTYTYRIFSRHGWIGETLGYDELRDYFMSALEPDVCFFQNFHALLVKTGHLFCRRKPLCESCPLNIYLDEPL
ncbi:MAG: endonuclease III domain-containing protein [Syntrophobacteraceae bacterium]